VSCLSGVHELVVVVAIASRRGVSWAVTYGIAVFVFIDESVRAVVGIVCSGYTDIGGADVRIVARHLNAGDASMCRSVAGLAPIAAVEIVAVEVIHTGERAVVGATIVVVTVGSVIACLALFLFFVAANGIRLFRRVGLRTLLGRFAFCASRDEDGQRRTSEC